MIRSVVRKAFWNVYDHLGACVALNLVWLVVRLPWLGIAYLVGLPLVRWLGAPGVVTTVAGALAMLWLSPPTLALLAVAWEWAEYRAVGAPAVARIFRRCLLRGLALGSAAMAAIVVLGANSAFYVRLPGSLRWVGYCLAGVMLWGQVLLLMVAFHLGIAAARGQPSRTAEQLRWALLLAMRFPVQTCGLCASTLLAAAAVALTTVGIPFLAASVSATLAATGERELIKRLRPRDSAEREADRLEERRTLRDLFRPWDVGR